MTPTFTAYCCRISIYLFERCLTPYAGIFHLFDDGPKYGVQEQTVPVENLRQ